jgi:DNA modification methylase
MRFELHHGDCLDVLKTLADCSVDAIVTDPPYGLSDKPIKSLGNRLADIFLDVVLPDLYNANVAAGALSEFSGPLESVTFLDFVSRSIREKSRVCVPVSALNLKSNIIADKEIENESEGAIAGADRKLPNVLDADPIEFHSDQVLYLRHPPDLSRGQGQGRFFRELGLGRIGVLVVIASDSKIAGFLRSLKPCKPSFFGDIVGACDGAEGGPLGSSGVVAGGGAEIRAVLSLNMGSGTLEFIPASPATEGDAVFAFACAEPVRAVSRTGGLAAKFEPLSFRFVGDSAGRALTIYFHEKILSEMNYTQKGFMGKAWDGDVPSVDIWVECLRVLKPGGHLLAFAGTRTQHRMAVRIEDAGFEIRDMIAWVYGQGFPKSLDVSKAIDKAAGAEREVVGRAIRPDGTTRETVGGRESTPFVASAVDGDAFITAPATEAAKQWEGWGTAIKPSLEPITLARKPLIGTVAANVLEHGTGGLNIGACRVGTEGGTTRSEQAPYSESGWRTGHKIEDINAGRWPANFIHDGSEEVLALFPEVGGGKFAERTTPANRADTYSGFDGCSGKVNAPNAYGDSGSAARFFYCAKASRDDRDEGLPMDRHSSHPTVKPTDLMRYLCRLVTPPNGIVLDPFTGSGSTGKAAMAEGFRFIGIEREAEYIEIARARISAEAEKPRQLSLF